MFRDHFQFNQETGTLSVTFCRVSGTDYLVGAVNVRPNGAVYVGVMGHTPTLAHTLCDIRLIDGDSRDAIRAVLDLGEAGARTAVDLACRWLGMMDPKPWEEVSMSAL